MGIFVLCFDTLGAVPWGCLRFLYLPVKDILIMMTNKGGSGKKKSKIRLVIKILVLIAVIAALAYLYDMYGTLPVSVLSIAASGKPLNFQALSSVITQKLHSEDVGAKYTGSITVGSDPAFNLTFVDYYGIYYYGISATSLPGFGAPQLALVQGSNSSYMFCELGSGEIARSLANSGLSETPGELNGTEVLCFQPTVSNATESLKFLNEFINLGGFQNVNTQSLGLGSYNGLPCYTYSGTGSAEINSTIVGSTGQYYIPATMKFNTCFSSQYLIPLSLNATFTAQNGATVNASIAAYGGILNGMNATSIQPPSGN